MEESLKIRRELGNKSSVAESLNELGRTSRTLGDIRQAENLHLEALALVEEIGDRPGIVQALEGLAATSVETERIETAGRLFGAAAALREEIGNPMPMTARGDHERLLGRARAQAEETFEQTLAEGRTMGSDQAIAMAARRS